MKLTQAILIAIISAIVTLAGLRLFSHTDLAAEVLTAEPAFERVMKTHTIRCAYNKGRPYPVIEASSASETGIAYDVIEEMGRILGLTIEWQEEVPPSKMTGTLVSGESDVMCTPLWPSGNRSGALDFTVPIDFIGAYAYERVDETRFDGDLKKIDDPNVTVAVIEGDYSQAIANEDYASAKQLTLPPDSGGTQLLLAVANKKADIAFADPFLALEFSKSDPGKIKPVPYVGAVHMYGDVFAVAKGETKLRDMLNLALRQMNQNGFIRTTLDKYLGDYKGQYFYPAKPWEQ